MHRSRWKFIWVSSTSANTCRHRSCWQRLKMDCKNTPSVNSKPLSVNFLSRSRRAIWAITAASTGPSLSKIFRRYKRPMWSSWMLGQTLINLDKNSKRESENFHGQCHFTSSCYRVAGNHRRRPKFSVEATPNVDWRRLRVTHSSPSTNAPNEDVADRKVQNPIAFAQNDKKRITLTHNFLSSIINSIIRMKTMIYSDD